MEQQTELKCIIATDKPDFNCLEYKISKYARFSALVCWKIECKLSLVLNDLDESSCILSILCSVQGKDIKKGKHCCSCTHSNTTLFLESNKSGRNWIQVWGRPVPWQWPSLSSNEQLLGVFDCWLWMPYWKSGNVTQVTWKWRQDGHDSAWDVSRPGRDILFHRHRTHC